MRIHLVWLLCLMAWFSGMARAQAPNTYSQKTRTFHSAEEFARLTSGKVKLHRQSYCPGCPSPVPSELLPESPIRIYARESNNRIYWMVLPAGVARHDSLSRLSMRVGAASLLASSSPKYTFDYFSGKRWLPEDKITGIGFERGTNSFDIVWLETPKGFSRIEYKSMTLADKSNAFVERVQQRHNRWGQTADSHLRVPGDLATNQMVSSDNDGLWTAMYVAAECFRFKVTGASEARENARVGMQALLRMEEISGIPGFPARSFIKVGVDVQPGDGEWHDTPDKLWRWKGDTSSDEIVGHYFIYPIYYDLVADEAEKQTLSAALDRITNHLLDHDYQLVDVDGKRTRWGYWGPQEIWEDPDETGLRALHILAHLRTAMHVTRNPQHRAKFQAAYNDLIQNHKYHLLLRNQKIMVPGHINHSDDELAFLSYYPLLQYETEPKLRAVYQQSLERSWEIERPERNPLWNFIYAVGCEAKEYDKDESVRTLREIPMELIEWAVKNSHRQDVLIDPLSDRFKRKQALVVLPYDELPMSKWNGNPYNLDGGNGGRSEDDGAYFLLPYWMGRYHKLIGE